MLIPTTLNNYIRKKVNVRWVKMHNRDADIRVHHFNVKQIPVSVYSMDIHVGESASHLAGGCPVKVRKWVTSRYAEYIGTTD